MTGKDQSFLAAGAEMVSPPLMTSAQLAIIVLLVCVIAALSVIIIIEKKKCKAKHDKLPPLPKMEVVN